jgi:hypothetical protein
MAMTRAFESLWALCILVSVSLVAVVPAQADPVYDDDWDWSGCKADYPSQYDEEYYSCEDGRDFEFFKRGSKRGYQRGDRICNIITFKDLPGTESPRLVWATCKEGNIKQFEVLKMWSCCGVLMIKRLSVHPELTQ